MQKTLAKLPLLAGSKINSFSISKNHLDIVFAVAMLSIIAVLIFPIPTWLVDFLLTISLTISVLILMTVLFIDKPLDFNSFPSVLLVATMLRLSLNIATTRLILSDGHNGTAAAGHIVEAFGTFIMQGSVVIGVIVFGILSIINFVVITKGSGRIAEVAARFSLDAMPGKQMAIDADLSAGLIDEQAAKTRRKLLEDESTFFGSMDGANKFVRGDAIAGFLIIFINLIGGVIIGVVQMDMSFEKAIKTYTILTIGDGLIAQIPALIISTAAGLLVTKSATSGSVEKAVLNQLGSYPKALGISACLLMLMSLMPGIPMLPFLSLAVATGGLSYYLHENPIRKQEKEEDIQKIKEETETKNDQSNAAYSNDAITNSLHIDSVKLELGYGLLSLLNYQRGPKLTDQIKALRKQIAKELGFIIPSVRIQDNLELKPSAYSIKIKEIECGKSEIRTDKLLVMNPSGSDIDMSGDSTVEPSFGLPAKWINEEAKEEALFKGYTVVDPSTVVITHLAEVIKDNITELLTYAQTQKLLDGLSPEHKKLAADVIPTKISITLLQRVLQGLLSEGVSIRDLPTILEALSEIPTGNTSVTRMIEQVRTRLSKQICHANTNEKGYIPIVLISPQWEQAFIESLSGGADDKQLAMAPSKLQDFVARVNQTLDRLAMEGEIPVLLTSSLIRPYVRSIIERIRPSIIVLSQNEITPRIKIKTLGQI